MVTIPQYVGQTRAGLGTGGSRSRIPQYQRQVMPSDRAGGARQSAIRGDFGQSNIRLAGKAASNALAFEEAALLDQANAAGAKIKQIEQDKNLVRTVGDSLGQLAQVMAKINQRADQAHIDDAISQYIEWDTDYYINDISTRKGAGVSTDLIRETKEARQKKIDELAEGLSPRAQAELKRQLQREYLSGQTSTAKHVRQEMEAYAIQAQGAKLSARIDSIYDLAPGLDAQGIEDRLSAAEADVEAYAQLKGIDPAESKRNLREQVHARVISDALATGNYSRAEMLLDRWGTEIAPNNRDTFKANIRKRRLSEEADVTAGNLISRGLGYNQAMESIDGISDIDLKDETKRRYKSLFADQKRQSTEELQDGYIDTTDTVTDLVQQSGLSAAYDFVDNLPENTENERKIKKRARTVYGRWATAGGKSPATDPTAYDKLLDKIVFAEITSEKELRADADAVKVHNKDLNYLGKVLQGSQKVAVKDMQVAYSRAIGKFGDTTVNEKERENRGQFMAWAADKIAETNRGDDPEYVQKLADLWVTEGRWSGAKWFIPDGGAKREFSDRITDERVGDNWIHPLAQDYYDQLSPTVRDTWLKAYGGDIDSVLVGITNEVILKAVTGPRSR
jgi:hypothetical protein